MSLPTLQNIKIPAGVSNLFKSRLFIFFIFILLPAITTYKQYHHGGHHNNYLIFIYTFFHSIDHQNLFIAYPEYADTNHYGPLFALVIAPFTYLPEFIGMYLWEAANALFLFYAIQTLPLKNSKVTAIYWIVAHELLTAMFSCQINPSIAAIIILSFTLVEKKQNFWATCLILFGTFIKLYGIVGLAFFFFAKEKPKYIAYCFFWALFFFTVPMVFFGPSYIVQQYQEWYISLSEKQLLNASLTSMQDMSIMGFVRRVFQDATIPNLPFLVTGLAIFCYPYLRISQYKSLNFRLMFLASAMIFAVIFSNSSESPTYIIAFCGVAIWFMIQPRPVPVPVLLLFLFAILFTTLAPSDLYPKFVRDQFFARYSFKAVPCVLIWIYLSYQMIFQDFNTPSRSLSYSTAESNI